jgi:nucleotide-binding universal stress UspA family protein
MYQRILVAIDGSEVGAHALRAALTLAKEQHARLRVAHVVDEPVQYALDTSMVNVDELDEALCAAGQKVLDAAATEARSAGIEPEAVLLQSPSTELAQEIVREAERWRADLIVTGTHGRHGVKRLLLGSVAEGVARRSTVPVLLTHGA